MEASSPAAQPGYTARARTLPNGVYHKTVSTRSVDPVDPKYALPRAPQPFPDELNRTAVRRVPEYPGTMRPRWDDLSDIPGASRQIQYVRPTPYDAFRYDDVPKAVRSFRWGMGLRFTKFEKIDVGKLPEVPFRRTIPSNPLEPEYNYDKQAEETFEFNASMRLGLRGTMRGAGSMEDQPFEVLGNIGSLRHPGQGGPQPENARKFTRDKGIKKLYTGTKPFRNF